MPLTEKGKKLKTKFRAQYGKKKGDSIFYAMENSGKLKKVIKARGGMDASKKDFKTPSSMPTASGSPFSSGYQGAKKTSAQINVGSGQKTSTKSKFPLSKDQVISTALNVATFPLGYIYSAFKNKKPKIEKDYGPYTKTKKPPIIPTGGDNNRPQLCPDGTPPPCKVTTTATAPTQPTNPFLKDFKAYNSGGVSSGPPPRRGPNPQVPPIKMRSGKMTNKYKMSCPHRPDGIRGMGAAIKGHKFIGVK